MFFTHWALDPANTCALGSTLDLGGIHSQIQLEGNQGHSGITESCSSIKTAKPKKATAPTKTQGGAAPSLLTELCISEGLEMMQS